MSFTNREIFELTADQLKIWRRYNSFHCRKCAKEFKVGDKAKWVYANSTAGARMGNFFVCEDCGANQTNDDLVQFAITDFNKAVEMAKKWQIYGPDWINEY